MQTFRGLVLASLFALSMPSGALTQAEDIHAETLDNGMKIIVLEDHSIPNANMYIFWRAGSRNEYPGTTGLAHFFEHMMFNGSAQYGPKMFDRTMEAAGGANNAYTTEDSTVYTNWFPSDVLETIFKLEADRIQNLTLDPAIVESERGVVTSERTTRFENSNFSALSEEVKGAAFRAHPYSWPVIGHESDIANWTLDDLQAFYKTYYAPNNAIVVIAGNVDTQKVLKLARQYFAPIPAQEPPREVHTVEPKQTGERRVYRHKASVSTPNIMMAFHVPEANHEDHYALAILADILTDGKSSRLIQSLVTDQQLATNVSAFKWMSLDPNLFYLYAVAAQNIDAKTLELALIQEINQVMKEGVTADELEKARNRRLVNFYREMATINGKADTIGSHEFYFGDFRKLFDIPQVLNKITPEHIQRVANKYLRKANRTVGILSAKEDTHDTDR